MKRKKVLLVAVTVLGALLAILGAALASDDLAWEMLQFTNGYSGIHHQSSVLYPIYKYSAEHWGWADAYYPNATHFELGDLFYSNGTSENPDGIVFFFTDIYDAAGIDSYRYSGVQCRRIQGINFYDTFPPYEFDQLGPSNNFVMMEQYVYEVPVQDCPFGVPSDVHRPKSIWYAQ